MGGDDEGDRLLSLLGSDWSARRSDLEEAEEAAMARRDDNAGGEDTPVVRSCAVSSYAQKSFCLFLLSAPLFLIPLASLVEEEDGPPPRPLDGGGELSIV